MATSTISAIPLGVYVGGVDSDTAADIATFDNAIASFSTLTGETPVFSNTGADWSQPVSGWLASAQWEANAWAATPDASKLIPVIGLPMASSAPGSETADQMFQDFVAGKFDSMIKGMVQAWAKDGFMTQYWKPGWEMNLLGSQPWYAGTSAQTEADYVKAFQHIYTVLHAAGTQYGVSIQVVWTPGTTSDGAANTATALYPGSSYVDVIGADVYSAAYPMSLYDWDKNNGTVDSSFAQWAADPVNLEHYWTYPDATQSAPTATGGNSLSLQDLINLAKSQGKPLAISETGSGGGGTQDVSNDAAFPQWLAITLAQSGVKVDMAVLWDSGSYAFTGPGAIQPALAAAWAQYFGANAVNPLLGSFSGSVTSGGTGLSGVAVALIGASGTVVASTTSSSTGAFSFSGLSAGSYQVKYTAPKGQTLQTGSAANPATGLTAAITLPVGQAVTLPTEIMLTNPATIQSTVLLSGATGSANGDPGVTVALLNASGSVIATTVSNSSGWFAFTALAAGSYQLQYTSPAGQAIKPGTSSLTSAFTIGAGQSVVVAGASMVSLGSIGGQVALGGAGDSGVTVALLNSGGTTLATTTTASNGSFSFANLAAGSYQVKYSPPKGQVLQTGSTANAATGLTSVISLANGQAVNLPTEALLTNPASISATVQHFGGATDPTWGGVDPGVSVALLNSAGQVIATTSVASNWYDFVQLAPGTYQLQYTAPAGQEIKPGTSSLSAPITLVAGQSYTAPSAAFVSAVTMNGTGLTVTEAAGGYYVTGNATHSTLTLGAGNQTVTLTGSADTIVCGAGNSTISAAGAGNVFNAGAGMTLLNSDGSAGNVFMLDPAATGTMTTISGFNIAVQDILDLKHTLSGTTISANLSNVSSFITATTSGANTILSVDTTGGHGTATSFATLSGVHTTVAALQSAHSFSLS